MKRTLVIMFDFIIRNFYPTKIGNLLKTRVLRLLGAEVCSKNVIDLGVIIKSPSKLFMGSNIVISCNTIITAGGKFTIDNNVMIGYGCKILSQNHIIPKNLVQKIRDSGHEFKSVHIKEDAWLASNVVILPGVTVGEGAVIAAGSIVTKNVEPFTIYAGVPARKIRTRLE